MEDFFRPLLGFREFSTQTLIHVVDILLVAYVNYRLLALIRGAKAWRIVAGIFLFVVVLILSNTFHLTTLHWITERATALAPVALVILLLPEMRAALEGIGKELGGWTEKLTVTAARIEAHTVEEIVAAVAEMSSSKLGSLIVLERSPSLDDVVSNGVPLDAYVSAALIGSIFYEGNPLHDGAVVIRGDKIAAAACRLPLSENRLDPALHMRHRAAVGITEHHDCIVVVTSEERGTISICREGTLRRFSTPNELRDYLNRELRHVPDEKNGQSRKKSLRRHKVAR